MHRKKQTAAASWSLFPDEAFDPPQPPETVQTSHGPDSDQHSKQSDQQQIGAPKIHDCADKLTGKPKASESRCAVSPMSYDHSELFHRLAQSTFRSRFHLSEKDKAYAREKGRDTLQSHAADFIAKRLAPAIIPNDGKQTPMRGHPVFRAQHATGCCCRGCFYKWHHIPPGRALTAAEQEYAVSVLMAWIDREMNGPGETESPSEPGPNAPINSKPTT